MAIINGTTGNDTLMGTNGTDTIYGLAGSDSITGNDGNDYLDGGDGNDTLDGGTGTDNLFGGGGNDQLSKYLRDGDGLFSGGSGDDTIWGGNGNDNIDGGAGNDPWLEGFAGNDSITGGDGNDKLYGDEGNDTLDGGAGNDTLYGGAGNDVYYISNDTTYIYDSAGTDTAYVSASFVKVPSSIENVTYLNGAQALPYWIDALLPDGAAGLAFLSLLGGTKTFNYTFPTSIPAYNTSADDAAGWAAMTSTQQSRVKLAFTYISSVVGLSFTQTSVADASKTIAFANNDQSGSSGYALYPSDSSLGSDLFLDNSSAPNNISLADGTFGAYTLIHEIGHTLGLEHPGNYNAGGGGTDAPYLTGTEDSTTWTVMSYEYSSDQYYLSFSPLDIAALHYLYGPSTSARITDDTYQVSTITSNFIWDGAGKDTITLTNVSQAATVYLTPGYWGYVGAKSSLITAAGQVTVNFGTVIEQLVGSNYSDFLYGNEVNNTIDGGAGNDYIEGWDGNDYLSGGSGNDVMYGGLGSDTFDWDSSKRSGNDTFYGGMGDDIFFLDSTGDSVIEYANEGDDAIWVDYSYSISSVANVENLFGYGINSLSLSGNNSANSFRGGQGNDSIDGGSGTDYVFYADNFADCSITYSSLNYIVKTKTEGTDSVTNIEFLKFLDQTIDSTWLNSLPFNITGTAFNETFTSTYRNDYIDGGEGIDAVFYSGSRSNYILTKGAVAYTVTDTTGAYGIDALTNVENLIFSNVTFPTSIDLFFATKGIAVAARGAVDVASAIATQLSVVYLGRPADKTLLLDLKTALGNDQPSAAVLNLIAAKAIQDGAFSANDSSKDIVVNAFNNIMGFLPSAFEQTEWAMYIDNGTLTKANAPWIIFQSYLGANNVPDVYKLPTQARFVAAQTFSDYAFLDTQQAGLASLNSIYANAARKWLAPVDSVSHAASKMQTMIADVESVTLTGVTPVDSFIG